MTWGAAATAYLPRVTANGKWCAAFSRKDSDNSCSLKIVDVSALDVTTSVPNGITNTWQANDGATAGACYNVVSNKAASTAVGGTGAPEILNFVSIAKQMPAAYNAAKHD